MRYPTDIKLEELALKYYPGASIHERFSKYFVLRTTDNRLICCAERFNVYPSDYTSFFCLSKESSHDGTVCQKQLLKRFPDLEIEEQEEDYVFRVKQFIRHKGYFPRKADSQVIYDWVKVMVNARHEMEEVDCKELERIPGWQWEWSRLTETGHKWDLALDASEANAATEEQLKTIQLLIKKMEKKELSTYFEYRIRILGLNISDN